VAIRPSKSTPSPSQKGRSPRGKRAAGPPDESPEGAEASDALEVRIVRSARRKKTVNARLLNWYTLEVRAPADIPDDQLEGIVQQLKARILQGRQSLRDFASDASLQQRAERLNRELFDNALRWRSIRFVSNQERRFGSCSPTRGTIRISHRLAGVPAFVLDYVIVHELAHLLQANHSRAFWELVYRYPKTERARGYLMAMGLEDDGVADDGIAEDGG